MANPTKRLTVGSNLNALDIYLNVDGAPINASGISFQVFDAGNFIAVSGVPTNSEMGHDLGSGVVPGNHDLGIWRIDWLIEPTGSPMLTASEQFEVQGIGISFTLDAPSNVTTSMFDAVRIDIADPESFIFNDEYLRRVLIKAVRRLNNKLGLAPTVRGPTGIEGAWGGRRIRVIPITLDIDAGTINPPGDEYEDLLILQMEYIILTSEVTALKRLYASAASGPAAVAVVSAINDDVTVRTPDGTQVSVGGNRLAIRSSLYRFDVERIERELDAAVRRYLARLTGNFGKLVF